MFNQTFHWEDIASIFQRLLKMVLHSNQSSVKSQLKSNNEATKNIIFIFIYYSSTIVSAQSKPIGAERLNHFIYFCCRLLVYFVDALHFTVFGVIQHTILYTVYTKRNIPIY